MTFKKNLLFSRRYFCNRRWTFGNEKSSARRIEKYIGESWQSLCSASRKEK